MGARRFYRLLLRLFPVDFREDFGAEMTRLFVERLDELRGRPAARLHLAARAVADVVGQALREWGGRVWTTVRDVRAEGMGMDVWKQDLTVGARGLWRRPGFAATAVATLALGLGANVAIFSVVEGVLLRPLPFPDSERIVRLWNADTRRGTRSPGVDHPDVRAWQAGAPDLLVAGFRQQRPTLTGFGDPEVIQGSEVTDGLFAVFGLEPSLGRDLEAADDVPGGPRVAVVSHAFWTDRLGRDPAVLGRTLELDGEGWEIVGVGPAEFDFPSGAQLWSPLRHDVAGCGHGCRIMGAIGRLSTARALEATQSRLDAISDGLARDYPDSHRDGRVELEPLLAAQTADVRTGLWVLMGAVGMVLLIACANVANLLLVRAHDRAPEVALRSALGARRARIVRQLLTESLLLSVTAAVLGVGLAHVGIEALVRLSPGDIPRLETAGLDGTALLYALALVVAVTALFGLTPALELSRRPLGQGLGSGRRAHGGRGEGRSRALLLTAEVALSLALLLGAGLLFRTLGAIQAVDMGFEARHVERFRVSAPENRYDVEALHGFVSELERRLAALPGVEGAGLAFGVPLARGTIWTSVRFLDREEVPPADRPSLRIRPATPGYLDAIGVPLLRGRWIDEADRRDGPPVAVIDETTARRFYPDADPLGRQLGLDVSWGYEDEPARTIVGVVGATRSAGATDLPLPAVYVPNAQFGANSLYATLRTAPGVGSVIPAARAVVAELDPALAITGVERLEETVKREGAATRFYLSLLGAFSAVALALAAVGLYGVVAYAVSRRTHEIGIRMALGARAADVAGLVVRQGARPALAGVALGLVASLAGGRVLAGILYGVEPQDPSTLATVTGLLLAVALGAIVLPARRAARIAPGTALRQE